MSVLFELQQITKRYNKGQQKVTVFDELNLEIDENCFLVVMGPSGSGKSTLLNILAGFEPVTSGKLLFKNQNIGQFSEKQFSKWRSQHVGFIFQFYNLIPTISAFKNVEIPLMLTKLSKKERHKRVETVLDIVGLKDRAYHRPTELSGGQQQRVAIARSIVSDAKILLCDEPTGDLDRESADDIVNTLKLMNEELNKSIIIVTHDEKLSHVANRILRCDKGKFFYEAPIAAQSRVADV